MKYDLKIFIHLALKALYGDAKRKRNTKFAFNVCLNIAHQQYISFYVISVFSQFHTHLTNLTAVSVPSFSSFNGFCSPFYQHGLHTRSTVIAISTVLLNYTWNKGADNVLLKTLVTKTTAHTSIQIFYFALFSNLNRKCIKTDLPNATHVFCSMWLPILNWPGHKGNFVLILSCQLLP